MFKITLQSSVMMVTAGPLLFIVMAIWLIPAGQSEVYTSYFNSEDSSREVPVEPLHAADIIPRTRWTRGTKCPYQCVPTETGGKPNRGREEATATKDCTKEPCMISNRNAFCSHDGSPDNSLCCNNNCGSLGFSQYKCCEPAGTTCTTQDESHCCTGKCETNPNDNKTRCCIGPPPFSGECDKDDDCCNLNCKAQPSSNGKKFCCVKKGEKVKGSGAACCTKKKSPDSICCDGTGADAEAGKEGDCCSGKAKDGKCCVTPGKKAIERGVCKTSADCCENECIDGSCCTGPGTDLVAKGKECTKDEECCSGNCKIKEGKGKCLTYKT